MKDRSVWGTSALFALVATLFLLIEAQVSGTFSQFAGRSFLLPSLHELGIALLIAACLNLSIEYINRRNMEANIERINRAVHKAVLKRSLPEELIDECQRVIFNADVYRYAQRVRYRLEKARSSSDSVKLSAHWTYYLRNVTKERVKYPMLASVYVNPRCPNECGIDQVAINGKELDLAEMSKHLFKSDRVLEFRREVFIDPGSDVKIEIKYRQVHTGNQSNEAICCRQPAMDMYVEVHVPNEDFIVQCTSLHPADEEQAHEYDGSSHFAWMMKRPSLPGQGMLLEWSPKSRNAS